MTSNPFNHSNPPPEGYTVKNSSTTPEPQEDWEERFDEQYTSMAYGEKWRPGMVFPTPSMIKSFIRNLLSTPMQYSEWVKYGKKYGFYDYFKEMMEIKGERNRLIAQIREEVKAELREKIKSIGIGLSLNEKDNTEYEKGYYGAIDDVLNLLND